MRLLLVGILVLTLGVAGVATYLIRTYKDPDALEELKQEKKATVIKVLVARKSLPIGSTISGGDVDWQVWVEEALNRELFIWVEREEEEAEKKKKIVGGIVRRAISAGEPILASKLFKREDSGFMAGMLESGRRAVSISVSPVTGASGFIFPGDTVDVVLTHNAVKKAIDDRMPKGSKAPLIVLSSTSETILRNIRILATGQKVKGFEKDSKAVSVKTVTLELTPKQAEIITTAQSMGKLSLVLRSLEGNKDETGPRTYTTDVEVSPMLMNIDAILSRLTLPPVEETPEVEAPDGSGSTAERMEELARKVDELTKRMEMEPAPPAEKEPSENEGVKEEKKAVVKIYRGQSAKTQEIMGK